MPPPLSHHSGCTASHLRSDSSVHIADELTHYGKQDITTSKLGAMPLGSCLEEDLIQIPVIPVSSNVTLDK